MIRAVLNWRQPKTNRHRLTDALGLGQSVVAELATSWQRLVHCSAVSRLSRNGLDEHKVFNQWHVAVQQGEKAAQELSYTVSLLSHKLASLASLASSWLKSCNTSNPRAKEKGHHRFCHWKILKDEGVKTLSTNRHHCSKGVFFWEPNPREADVIYLSQFLNNP